MLLTQYNQIQLHVCFYRDEIFVNFLLSCGIIFSERERPFAICRLSVVCNVCAPYSDD